MIRTVSRGGSGWSNLRHHVTIFLHIGSYYAAVLHVAEPRGGG